MESKLPFIPLYKTKMVEPIHPSTRAEREAWIKDAHYCLFNLRSEQVLIDLLTDSGTGAMSDHQWSELMLGDESYAGASSFFKLKDSVAEIFGFPYVLPTHQGRGAENVFFSTVAKEGDIVPGNSPFDTTKAHMEFRKARPCDCTIDEAFETGIQHPFKGNVNLDKLEACLKTTPKEHIPCILMTITCNSAGGQPVSLENMKGVHALAKKYGIPLFIDSARFAENAYFIQCREPGCQNKSIKEIVREIYDMCDGMLMSAKKDGIVNIGGMLCFRSEETYKKCTTLNILFEGFVTYGGMAGRDMGCLSVGLREAVDQPYIEARVRQVEYVAGKLKARGIPHQEPCGGHAIFLDAKKFLPHIPKEEFPAQTLGIELYIEGGVRGVEIGAILADRDPETREERYPKNEFVRLAIPWRVYSQEHMDFLVEVITNVFNRRDKLTRGVKIVEEAPILRHFTVKLERL